MRFLARLLSVVIPLTLLIGGSANAREWKAIEASGTIKAATEGAFQPFNYYEGSTLTGFEVELAEAIAKKLGLKLEWSVVPFDAQIAALKQDRFDFAIASHGYTPERAKSVDFANPHYCTGGQIAAHKDGPLTVAALNGKSVGVQLATTYAGAAKKINGIKAIKTYKGDPEAFSALRAKKVDAWISDKFTVKGTLDKNPDAGIVGGELVFVEKVSMIMPKGNKELAEKLNQALAEVMKDDSYQMLSQKYFKEDVSCRP
ncbi:MAG: Sulfate starvation-induced protein 7 [Candidatus Accumulibacter appositus]|uniref:Sulfate starvation-induced protein 7 n=1 Tax=Candidatus Accumulibacter appositus TaxID=1454003 RepID=A0A011N5D1_9PROT|nr:ABC transporter substrate-binding protein [Accumulibacter sp.]EXI77788.1 MAG: Sulfate starvation-induced protein 7 [Candidatus Accumulibacter appositus]HRF05652.1 ABC transporter substrate-binding protein [Accumulibacter sp.]